MDMISVGLQKSLVAAQHKLWMAIKEHQKSSQQLTGIANDPQDKQLQSRMKMIEIKILEIDRWQKDLYCQLRKEIAALNSETALNAAKHWLAEALQLNNNNHIIRNGANNATLVNGHASSSSNVSEDEEPPPQPPQQNGDVASPLRGSPTSFKGGREEASESGSEECSPEALSDEEQHGAEVEDKKCFLGRIGLISKERLGEIERRRNQRKRRSNVRSQFLYSAPQPPKRKRYAYLQSGNAPQTRQTTARLNGPSPTPSVKSTTSNSTTTSVVVNHSGRGRPSKAMLLQRAQAAAAAALAAQTAEAEAEKRNNSVLRNGDAKQQQQQQHKEFSIKQKTDNGNGTMKISSTGKTVHIPGLPPSLTVEWIDKDSTVCISCRNPGSLTMCESCSSKFHVSCHTITPASTSHCPKCVTRFPVKAIGCGNELEILRHEVKHVKKEYRDKAAGGESSRTQSKGGENQELHKTIGELYKTDTTQSRQQQQQSLAAYGISQLPSETLLISITSSASAPTTTNSAASPAPSHDTDDNSNFGSNTGFSSDMAEIVRQQLPETSVTTTASRNEWRRLALQSSGHSIVQRRPSSESTPIKPIQSIFPLQSNLPERSSTKTRAQSNISLIKPRNYVTVEIVDEDGSDDDEDNRANDAASENSADCVYPVSGGSKQDPDVIDLEPQSKADEPAQQEPEVFNISSGSSELNASGSPELEPEPEPEPERQPRSESEPQPEYEAELVPDSSATESAESTAPAPDLSHDDLETPAKSSRSPSPSPKGENESVADDARKSPAPSSPDNEPQQQQSDPVSDREFLDTLFPGDFGYRLVIQFVPPEAESSDNEEDDGYGDSSTDTDNEHQQPEQQHVKLEEAHLPAPLGPELNTSVPDNKSDDAASQDSTSVEKPTEESEPTLTTE